MQEARKLLSKICTQLITKICTSTTFLNFSWLDQNIQWFPTQLAFSLEEGANVSTYHMKVDELGDHSKCASEGNEKCFSWTNNITYLLQVSLVQVSQEHRWLQRRGKQHTYKEYIIETLVKISIYIAKLMKSISQYINAT